MTQIKTKPEVLDGRSVKITKNNVHDVAAWIRNHGGDSTAFFETEHLADGSQNVADYLSVVVGSGKRAKSAEAHIGDKIVKRVHKNGSTIFTIIKAL